MCAHRLEVHSADDKYSVEAGNVLISGRQALVRLPMAQRRLDRKRGWNTAGFISGYRGSPLGAYDSELVLAKSLLVEHDILFQPGVNEDLAATAVWGTQQVGFLPGRKVDGVFSIWYGKGPGVDRSGDPFKHANLAGTEPRGGILLAFGDDHAGKSSSTAHQSDLALAAHDIPIFYPASVAEVLEYGLWGIALSRFSGLLVGLKLVNETADATAVVSLDEARCPFEMPAAADDAAGAPADIHIRKEFLALQEQDVRIARSKLPRAKEFVRANRLDRVAFGPSQPKFVVVTAGKAYADVMGALEILGIDADAANRIGLAVFKVAMIFPLEPNGLIEVTGAAEELLFVEEKRPHIERQAAHILINLPRHPRMSGKADPNGAVLLPADVPLDPITVARALQRRLCAVVSDLHARVPAFGRRLAGIVDTTRQAVVGQPKRRPTFCAGCPHSTSTAVPTDSVGMTGIGCHALAMFVPDTNPLPVTHMGGEGATWLGIAPFTTTQHVFQNLGDGTYNHSGSLAIRAAIQAGARITYKILYNDAVAMTGGQEVEGHRTVGQIAAQMLSEGVSRVVVVSDRPERFRGRASLPRGVHVHHRDRLDEIQRELREVAAVTVLIYDQMCATEQRRRRKRAQLPPADSRVFINHLVCEGCGDCSVQSNCLAIQPLETELGRKRKIDQFACNQDISCTKGFCPSFVTLEGAVLRRAGIELPEALLESLPEPPPPVFADPYNILISGIGGAGVLTISAIVGMAAHLDGHGVSLYDMTGLSQKGGAVFSHVRIFSDVARVLPARITHSEADVVLACDLVAAIDEEAIRTIRAHHTAIVANTDVTTTAAFHTNPDLRLAIEDLLGPLRTASGNREALTLPANSWAERLAGDPIAANLLILGFAWQHGLIPLKRRSIERAIELNGTAVPLNLKAFLIGRVAAAFPEQIARLMPNGRPDAGERVGHDGSRDLEDFIARRMLDLTAYQNERYAARYSAVTREAIQREAALTGSPGAFAWAVARAAFKLMAYKDEYEVARLYSDGRFAAELSRQFASSDRLKFHLAPPLWSRPDSRTGRPRKVTFGRWILILFRLLAKLKWLRDTRLDPFGWIEERRLERSLRDEYLVLAVRLSRRLDAENRGEAIALAQAPLKVRGFGVVKISGAKDLLARIRLARGVL